MTETFRYVGSSRKQLEDQLDRVSGVVGCDGQRVVEIRSWLSSSLKCATRRACRASRISSFSADCQRRGGRCGWTSPAAAISSQRWLTTCLEVISPRRIVPQL
jgi:hypothetical protein